MNIKDETGNTPNPFRELQDGECLKFIRRAQKRDGGFMWRGEAYRWEGDIVVWADRDDNGVSLGRVWTVAEHVDEYYALAFIALFEADTKVST